MEHDRGRRGTHSPRRHRAARAAAKQLWTTPDERAAASTRPLRPRGHCVRCAMGSGFDSSGVWLQPLSGGSAQTEARPLKQPVASGNGGSPVAEEPTV